MRWVNLRDLQQTAVSRQRPFIEYVGDPCPYCGVEMTRFGKRGVTRDHLRPKIMGTSLTPGNRVIACRTCNEDKKHYEIEVWYWRLRNGRDPRADRVGLFIGIKETTVSRDGLGGESR